jgi:pSer/pThr/pTyr-binding forkhead associated (FHA) protein
MSAIITVIVTRGAQPGQRYVFTEPGAWVIGRASDCSIRLPPEPEHWDVSRHHCVLEVSPPSIRVRDLNSRNGTYVNGEKIRQEDGDHMTRTLDFDGLKAVELGEGDEVQLGDHTAFRVSISAPAACAAEVARTAQANQSLGTAEAAVRDSVNA